MMSPKKLGADRHAAQCAFADRGPSKQNPTVLGQAKKERRGGMKGQDEKERKKKSQKSKGSEGGLWANGEKLRRCACFELCLTLV